MDLTNLMKLRTVMKLAAQERGISFSYMPIFIKVNITLVFMLFLIFYCAIFQVFAIMAHVCSSLPNLQSTLLKRTASAPECKLCLSEACN